MMLKGLLPTLFLTALFLLFTSPGAFAEEIEEEKEPILHVENEEISGGYFTDLNHKIDELKELDQGTIIVRFRHEGSSFQSLFSLSNNNFPNGHFHLYVSPSAIGSENRYQAPGEPQTNTHISQSLTLENDYVHTLAMVVDQEEGYKYYLNGELVLEDTTSSVQFLNNIYEPNSAQLGRTERAAGGNQYTFHGDIDFATVYGEPLQEDYLVELTGETARESLENPLPDDAMVTDPYNVFYPGFMDSNNYRIPALFYTEKGTLIAGIDRRVESGADSPNDIHSAIRRSYDQGETWEDEGIIINAYPDDASNIDLAFTQDNSNERIFALVDGFPHGAGLMGGFGNNAYPGTGYTTVNGEDYMFLLDEDENEYTIREEGIVYDGEGNPTSYKVDENRDLYLDGEKIDNIFSETTPLKPYKTSYLELYHSDDEGDNWTGPIDLNPETKEEWMIFLGVGPGNGIQLSEGEHEGRIIFPVYFINENLRQASAVVYSDDGGETWQRGESPNQGRVVDGNVLDERYFDSPNHEITEAQVVEMPDGQLKMFMRNYSGYAQVATSYDGGETWDSEVITETDLVAPYSQMSAIRYDGQIDGKDAVIFSSANDHTSRINGTVRVGLIEENGPLENGFTDYSFDWKYEQLVKEGHYGYSSLTNLPDGELGLFYEGTPNTVMDFIKFNTDFLKWERHIEEPTPELINYTHLKQEPNVYRKGDSVKVELEFDDFVVLMGDQTLKGEIDGHAIKFNLVESNNSSFTFEATLPDLKPRAYDLNLEFSSDLTIYNKYGKLLDTVYLHFDSSEKIKVTAGNHNE
ncbi:sialidase family protein [Alkalibacillus haloalkaliphilus]|uniref:exo-alpha-sialidase n=1 Tax=Alkalibacillus haloalkaliphilus TaxID=94136 RepID=A0A511W6B4_9BACI|nr:sialidase family protein [Alkalibacillus haloalkaliphilus]GEN46640.1 hypothetical protein AHA02nite_24160 [Alkalibacillus haloalkaliphilus]